MIGDPNQTQAVEAGSAFRMALENTNSVSVLQEIWRQNRAWQREASKLFAGDRNDIFAALDIYKKHGRVKACDDHPQLIRHIVNDYVDQYSNHKTQLILTHTNKDVGFLNIACREKLKHETKELSHPDFILKTGKGNKYFCVNDRIIFLKNDRRLNVKNGSFGTIKSIDSLGHIVVALDNQSTIAFDVRRYDAINYGYAATVHKTQGATIDSTYFLAGQGNDRHLAYVAMTRHRQDAHLYYSKEQFQNFEHVKRTLSNSAQKKNIADYKSNEGNLKKLLTRLTSHNLLFRLKDVETGDPDLKDHIVPIVKNHDGSVSYTTDIAIETEKKMYQSAENLSKRRTHALSPAGIDKLSCHLFAQQPNIESFEKVLCSNDLVVLNHGIIDSAEKTYFLKSLKDVYQDLGYVVEGISLSGLGADNLKQSSGIEASTISKNLLNWDSGRNQLTGKSLLIVDNANIVGTASMQKILRQAEKNNAKLILVGNKHLLQPLEAGSPLRGIIENYQKSVVELKSHQSSSGNWYGNVSEMLIGDRESVSTALDMCVKNGTVFCLGDDHKAKDMIVLDWLKKQDKSIIVAQRKAAAETLNTMAHERLKESGKIGTEEHHVNGIGVCTSERIMFLKNDHSLGVKNGTVGTVKQIKGNTLYVDLGTGHDVVVNTTAYQHITYGYAINIHKLSDNISYDKLFVHATVEMDRNSVVTVFQAGKDIAWYHSFDSNFDFRRKLSREKQKHLISDFWQNPLSKEDQDQSRRQLKLKHGIDAEFWNNEEYGRTVSGIYEGIIKLNDHQFARFDNGKTILAPYHKNLEPYQDCRIKYDPNTRDITKPKEHYYELYLKDKDSGRTYHTKTICAVFDSSEVETAKRNAAVEFCKKNGIRNAEADFKRLTYLEKRKSFISKVEQGKSIDIRKNFSQKAKQRKMLTR